MSVGQRLEVSHRAPGHEELHRLFREQDLLCGNVEEWSRTHFSAVVAQDRGCYVRAGGTLVGAALRDGRELLLAVAPDEGLERGQIATTLLQRAPGAEGCWVPTDDSDLPNALASQGWRPLTVDLQMRLRLPRTTYAALPDGVRLAELTGLDDAALHGAVHELACDAWGVASSPAEFLDRYVRHPAYDAGLWVVGHDGDGVCGAAIGRIEQLPDARVGKVASLAVAPRSRGRGLAAALLGQLCRRFASRGLSLAQLGVHEDNCSGAPAMYRHLGWVQASSKTQWESDV